MKVIALTGGIGSGKSVVSAILLIMGHAVYDCDRHAKKIMDFSDAIKQRLVVAFGPDSVNGKGEINRKYIGGVVFNNPEALLTLNGIVHPEVRKDLQEWIGIKTKEGYSCVFVETAILKESNLKDMVNAEWNVYAPVNLRIQRVMKRNNLSEAEVRARIESQSSTDEISELSIINDDINAILPQIERNLKMIGAIDFAHVG